MEDREQAQVSADALAGVRRHLRDQLRERVDARGLASAPRTERRVRVREEALGVLRQGGAILPQRELTRVVNEVADEVVGFGSIEFLLKDPSVTEVMVNGPDDVYVEREGRIERAPDGLFEGEESVLHLIERIVGPLGLRVDESSPWADARLPDGSRVHAIIPPLSLRGPTLTIRKFSQVPIRAEDLLRGRSLGPRMLRFLEAAVRGRANVVVSGGTGSGKTTLLGRAERLHPRRGAADHDRGRGRAPAGQAARRGPGGPARQRRGSRRGDRSGSRAQRAAHAPRPDHRRRGARRRGPRHVAGHEHGPRGIALHRACEQRSSPAVAPRDDGDDVGRRAAGGAHPQPGRVRGRRRRAARPAARRPPRGLGDRRPWKARTGASR